MLAIGLMSGTSLDGVDAALIEIKTSTTSEYRVKKFITLPYPHVFKNKIMRNLNDITAKLSEISTLNFELGYYFVDAIDLLLKDTPYKYSDIAFVASHGQTIWHDPRGLPASTLQIGDASVISYRTNITTVSNFRVMDIAAGGEGAPLVVFADYMLFKSDNEDIVLQNIGGIANLTYLKKKSSIDDIIAFDTGVGNIMIDYFMNKYYNLPYDDNGKTAFSGKVIKEVFEYLKGDIFVTAPPPKSTGREQYNATFMENMASKLCFDKYAKEDIITTVTEFTAYNIAYNYRTFLGNVDKAIISGGGAHNKYILKRIKEMANVDVYTLDEYGLNSDAKEALAFAILGHHTLLKRWSNVKGATGAKADVILGNITYGARSFE